MFGIAWLFLWFNNLCSTECFWGPGWLFLDQMTENHDHTTLVETEAEVETLIGADLKISGGPSGEPLPRKYIVSYGMGHMLNDLTSACWFTYLLMFLTDVGLSPRYNAIPRI